MQSKRIRVFIDDDNRGIGNVEIYSFTVTTGNFEANFITVILCEKHYNAA